MMTLEKRYVRSQNDLSSAADEAEKFKAEILSLQSVLEQVGEKYYFLFFSFIAFVMLVTYHMTR